LLNSVAEPNDPITIITNADREVAAVYRCGSNTEPLFPMILGMLGLSVVVARRR